MVWCLTRKNLFSSITIIKIATYIAASIFNTDFSSVLFIMNNMSITIGPTAIAKSDTLNEKRIQIANKRMFESSKKGQIVHKSFQLALQEF